MILPIRRRAAGATVLRRVLLSGRENVQTISKACALRTVIFVGLVGGFAGQVRAQLFTASDLIVTAYGNNSTTTAQGASTPITLLEFSTSGGSPILTDALPTSNGVGGSANVGVVGEYGSSSEGNIQLSANGQY